jgi:prolyl-tRNA editing enzyme YbaK/EbsC (Cys-tRNA(Pro) deacylase)
MAVGCQEAEIAKSIVFVADGDPVVCVASGRHRIDTDKLADVLDVAEVRQAAADEVRAATGFEPGAVAPFPLPRVARVLVDRQILVHERVWIGAGSSRHLATLAPADLVRLAKAEPMDAVAEAA